MIDQHLETLVMAALEAAARDGVLDAPLPTQVSFEKPRRREHGDWATNIALAVAKGRGNPREVAAAIRDRLPSSDSVDKVEIAGPGFLNFYLSAEWLHDVVARAARSDGQFGRSDAGSGVRVNVEYVSSNPTGPINVVSGRQAAVGDSLANLLEATGHEVTREFYINDAGLQATLFARSVAARYQQRFGREGVIPPEGYQGDYVIELAEEIAGEFGDRWVEADEADRVEALREIALSRMLARMRASLERFGTSYEIWFSEATLHRAGAVDRALGKLRSAGLVFERDGAQWFRSSDFGDDKDRVIVRSNGEPTYL
ncbi:MAG: arginine--tRNA ligase, partial [Actinomycetota bacterium]|nr:arginine--tRNA ligase [Actinomycetota bacterium]